MVLFYTINYYIFYIVSLEEKIKNKKKKGKDDDAAAAAAAAATVGARAHVAPYGGGGELRKP